MAITKRYVDERAGIATVVLSLVLQTVFAPPLLAQDNAELERVLAAQKQRMATMEQAARATVAIFGLDGGGGGSGVLISPDGYALTNYHVSSACGDHMRCGLNDGRVYDAVIVGIDATGDVSLIKLLGRDDFPVAPLADSDTVKVGQWCFAAGNPFVLATNLQPSVSFGMVSGVNRYQYPAGTLLEYADCIQTDAAINPGNSGGPLFNMAGEVIGVNGRCSFEKRGRINVGVGYAISANQLKHFLGNLKSGRLVDHATLGATVATDENGKILVSNILPNSDAYRRGLRYGDEVIRFADRDIPTTNMFKNVLGTLPKGWRVPIRIRKDGNEQTLLVRLAGVHTDQQLIDLVAGELLPGPPRQEEEPEPSEGEDEREGIEDEGDANSTLLDEELLLRPNKSLVGSMLAPKPGYANYHFNELNQQRVDLRLRTLGDYKSTADTWTLRGSLLGEPTKFELNVGPGGGAVAVGFRNLNVQFDDGMSDIIAQRRETGLLVALRAFQECLRLGVQKIGSTSYQGVAPVYEGASLRLGDQPRHDVLECLWYDTRMRIFVEPESGFISLIEVFGDEGNDPVEVYFSEYKPFEFQDNALQLPTQIRLQYGMQPNLVAQLSEAIFELPDAE